MATAKDVKTILQQTMDGVDNVKLVNDSVKAVDEMVKTMADGGQRLFIEVPASSPIFIIQTVRKPPRKRR